METGHRPMSDFQSFLAVPIKASISSKGWLLSADPPVWRLHNLAGGGDNSEVAIPALAALAATALRTGMRIERPVRAADEENDIELWVTATPQSDRVDLLITGWRDVAPPTDRNEREESVVRSSADINEILIDPEQRVVRLPSAFPSQGIGQHFGSLFVVESDADGRVPLIDALMDRRAIMQMPIGVIGKTERFLLDLTPQFALDGRYLGHVGRVTTIEADEAPVPSRSDLPMSRQLASVLKQPLNRIVANAETIGSRIHGPLRDNYAEYAQDIANAARHLAELVSDMEDLDAIDRPDFSAARDRLELGDIARRVGGLLALKASDHGISLMLPAEADKVAAIGEFRRVLQVMLNLVGNAIRYAPGGSIVTITIEKQADFAAISVSDQGQGVPKDDRERVFEKFERLGRSGDGGSGLGLFISRKLARAMGGDLVVTDASGGGACFRLTLPAR
jgi:Histidine kinase-, DNA gyrase B-, and HSP90-like ATPase/His Kinase A (phospho-acceptor) domain